jgi:drug/metabolite transporter (DMT)-like permease
VLAWGTGPVIAKHIDLQGIALTWHRLWLGALSTGAIVLLSRRPFTAADLRRSVPGGVAFALNAGLFFVAVKETTVANATVIAALQPALLLVVVGPLFGERVDTRAIAMTVVAVAGVVVVMFGSAGSGAWSPLGDLLAVGALLAWAWYFVAAKQARAHIGSLPFLLGIQVVAAALMTPLALASRQRLGLTLADWGWLAVMVLVPGAIGHLFMNWAHRYTTMQLTSALTLAIPVVATVAAAVALDEQLVLAQVLGMAVVVGSLAAIVRRTAGVASR